ncbi:hypothetical protein ElyMa_001958000 [Elysia marginata]|uniref:Uncharacterized protein n=1 Tax=Elysia marginata TaxID=1093978 RepID=A0AAV4EYS2_9GAST|nr:hypothetical protein ElyMa_001958000 [Elysia marginata]
MIRIGKPSSLVLLPESPERPTETRTDNPINIDDFPALPSVGQRGGLLRGDNIEKTRPIATPRPVGVGAYAKPSNTYFREMDTKSSLKDQHSLDKMTVKDLGSNQKLLRPRLSITGPYKNLLTVDAPCICTGLAGHGVCANFLDYGDDFRHSDFPELDNEFDRLSPCSDEKPNSEVWPGSNFNSPNESFEQWFPLPWSNMESKSPEKEGGGDLSSLRKFLSEHAVGGTTDEHNTVHGGEVGEVEDYLFKTADLEQAKPLPVPDDSVTDATSPATLL